MKNQRNLSQIMLLLVFMFMKIVIKICEKMKPSKRGG